MSNRQDDRPHRARDLASHGLGLTVRLVGVFAAVLAFGLFGLLAGVWHLVWGRRRAALACRGCRRRRSLVLAGTYGLAGLVLVGSGMAGHQQVSAPGLPRCGTELSASVAGEPDHALAELAGATWRQTQQVLTAPVSGLAHGYVDSRGGGLCEKDGMTLAFLPAAASDSGVAVGSVVMTDATPYSMGKSDWDALASHESRHVTQWATLTLAGGPLAMPVLYAVDEAFFPGSRNHFERGADLRDGGYQRPDSFSPRPQWPMVAGIGVLLAAACRPRVRWASRVLTGGPAAAAEHEHERCSLHSRGWFRMPASP